MNILLTGCAGFIGSSLIEKLIDNNKIIGIDNFDNYYPKSIKQDNMKNFINNSNFNFYETDIRNRKDLEKIFLENKIDAVIHLAAKAGVRKSFEIPEEYIAVNIGGTVNILECMKKYNVKKLIFASSSSVYGDCSHKIFKECYKENNTISPYAQTKKTCEEFIRLYSQQYKINSVALRFFTVFGPKQRPDLAIHKFARLIKAGEKVPIYGDGTTYRDYTYISDITDGIIAALNYNKTNFEAINLGSSSPVNLMNMVKCIENDLGKKAELEFLPMQNGDVNGTFADITKAKELLGYSPKISFENGVHKFLESLS